jgi:hypothetical protein
MVNTASSTDYARAESTTYAQPSGQSEPTTTNDEGIQTTSSDAYTTSSRSDIVYCTTNPSAIVPSTTNPSATVPSATTMVESPATGNGYIYDSTSYAYSYVSSALYSAVSGLSYAIFGNCIPNFRAMKLIENNDDDAHFPTTTMPPSFHTTTVAIPKWLWFVPFNKKSHKVPSTTTSSIEPITTTSEYFITAEHVETSDEGDDQTPNLTNESDPRSRAEISGI